MTRRGGGVHVWALRLTPGLLALALLRHGAGIVLHVESVSRGARICLDFLARFGVMPGLQVHDVGLPVTDEHGRALSLRLEWRLLTLADALPLDDDGESWIPDRYRGEADGIRRAMRSYYCAYNREALILPVFAECAYRTGRVGGDVRLVECLVRFPCLGDWTAAHLPFDPGPAARLVALPSTRAALSLLRVLPESPRQWIRRLFRRVPRPEIQLDPEARRQGVVLQQNIAWIFEQYPAGGHLYWHDGSGLDPARVVLYCNRRDAPLDDATRKRAGTMGLGWADAAFLPDHLARPLIDGVGCLGLAASAFPRRLGKVALWRWTTLCQLTVLIESYRALIRQVNAKAAYQSWVFLPQTLALALALRLEGGVFLWNFWSIHPLPVALHHFGMADLVFSWGPYHRGFYHVHRLDYRTMVDVGIVMGDGHQDGDAQRAAGYRAALAPHVRFVLTVLDTSYGPEASNSLGHVVDFYRSVLGLLRAHPDWGCIIKSKSIYDSLPRTTGLQDVVASLEAEGRCLRVQFDERVSVVARAGDLAVCSSINSAGFLAAVAGRPALHLDLAGIDVHPVARDGGVGQVIFRDVAGFEAAIEAVAGGDTRLGDHSPWLDLIDPFRDGEGRSRVAAIIGAYMRGREDGKTAEAAIADAVEPWRSRTVVCDNGIPASDKGDVLWRQAYERGREVSMVERSRGP
ncbi:conserved hypothetical protein [Magnetospirillum sp. LM-5]|uniref:hypothetical protein n=1 Tax=Magnetospirillum sp. LM-5 TaxID=2681466 RepID=UPI00137EE5D6|nr:hypothetical protein [Magnetospirillum sp. LM-5]CAA7622583.1 conserved hypothetical protein [Magnetospirillum sp. LM-5]